LLPRCIIATATSIPGQCIHRRITSQKVSIFFYFLPQNSEKSANNRFHAKLVKYANFYDIFADVWPILMKFCIMTHISYPEHNSCSKVKFKKKIKIVDAAVLKNCQMRYISYCFTDFDKVCYHDANATSIRDQCIHDTAERFNFLPVFSARKRKKRKEPFSCQTGKIFKLLRYLCRRLTNSDGILHDSTC